MGAVGLGVLGLGEVRSARADEAGRRVLIEDLVDEQGLRAASATPLGSEHSGLLAARQPFTHVGLHWRGSADVAVDLQTSRDGQDWTAWQRLVVERRRGETVRADRTFA